MTPLLQTRDLKVFYGDFQAVFGVDFEVNEGETVAIIGANGAGKSSFLKALSGLVKSEAGAILLDGRPVGGTPAYDMVKSGIALVPEGRRLFPSMTVADNLRMGENGKSGDRGWNYETICDLFPLLRERADQLAPTLSGGQQQMVAIGRALMLIVDLRLIGVRLMNLSFSDISHATLKWTWLGFALAVVTGLMMFSERATHYVTNTEFLIKMGLLGLAGINMLIFEFLTRRSIVQWDSGHIIPGKVKVAGLLSLAFWFGVIVFGRLIGFADAYDPLANIG